MLWNGKLKRRKVQRCEDTEIVDISEILINQVRRYLHNRSGNYCCIDLEAPPEIPEDLKNLTTAQLINIIAKMVQEDKLHAKIIGSFVIF